MDHITGTIYQKGIKQNIFALTMATYRTNVCGTKKANTKKKKKFKAGKWVSACYFNSNFHRVDYS